MNTRRLILFKKQKKEESQMLFIVTVFGVLIFNVGFVNALGFAFFSLISLFILKKCFEKKRSSLFGFER